MNRNLYISFLLFLIVSILKTEQAAACGFDFTGSCGTTARFSVNNISKDYFVSPCSYGVAFPTSLGTGITHLQLTNASTRTWESCTNFVMQSAIFYRIYNDPLNKGAFIKADLQQLALFNSPPYRTKTYSGAPNSDLLQGLIANTAYTIEVYYQLFVDTDGNNTIDVTPVLNNNGAFYKSTFQTGNISTNMSFPVNGTTTNVTCTGGNNASATAVPAGGVAPYTYLWSNNATTETITGLTAGSYSVTVTDATTAIGIRSFTIIEPSAMGAILSNTNPSCGLTNGAISAAGYGGTSPYTYLWSTSATIPTLSNLAQGTYSVTVKDVNNCIGIASTSLIENCGTGNTYCASNSQAPWNEWIARVQLNNLDNSSSKTRADRYAVGYSDWKDKSTTLTKGLSYPLSILPELSWSGAQTNLFYRVWIDFNKNGVFEDTEKVFEQNKVGLVAANGTVVVPASALTGGTVMRVSMKKDAYSTACETFPAGEVEDYSLILQAGSGNPCASDVTPPTLSACPQNMSLTTAGTTAIATWTAPTATDNCTANPTITSNFSSGESFSLGNTPVTYTAQDSSNNTATCSFTVSVIDTTVQNICKKYPVSNTHEICQQTWKPYGMKLIVNNIAVNYQAQSLVFENFGTTAVLRGTYRSPSWAAVQIILNFTGGTTVAHSGSPTTSACSGNGTGYTYFTAMSGTVVINGQTLTIARRGAAFQVGIGANLQNLTDLGASGQFTLSDGTLGEFGFKLGAQTVCTEPDPVANLAATHNPILQLDAHQEYDKAHLIWVNNTSFKNDYFEIQKADVQGNFKIVDVIKDRQYDNQLHDYIFTDSDIRDGENSYRIKTVFIDGTSLLSAVKTLTFSNFNNVVIYPNPASDKVFLGLKQYGNDDVKIMIYNSLGSFEKQFTVSNNPNVPIELDIESLKSGHYFMRIVAQGKRDMVKQLFIGK